MKYFEFGRENPEVMVMLHGGGVSYRGMLPAAKEMAKVYHVVLVAYDGFNPDEPETEFKSPMDEARRLGDFIAARSDGRIDVLYALSYGCRVMMEVLRDERLTITTAIADGMGLRDYPNIRSKWGKDVYCFFYTGLFYAVMGHPGRSGRNSWRRSPEGRSRRPTESSTERRRGGAGGIRTIPWSVGKPTIRCSIGRTCTSGTGSGEAWIKSCPPT